MRRLFLTKVVVHVSTLIYFVSCLLTGWFKESLIAFFIVLGHEYAHTLAAIILHYQVKEIHLYPFGAFVEIEDYGLHANWQDLLVAACGPLSYFLLFGIGEFAKGMLGVHGYLFFQKMNLAVCLFNLLPIWPMDGAKILLMILSYLMDYLQALKMLLPVSFLTLVGMILYFKDPGYLLVYSYLVSQIIFFGKDFYYYYLRLLFSRDHSHDHGKARFHLDRSFLKPYQNFYLYHGRIIDEKEFINTKIFIDNE